jgi:hypothetical protein
VTLNTLSEHLLTALDPPGATLRFNLDPRVEQTWDARKVTTPGLEGAVTTQDFGTFAKDCYRTLTWAGAGQWLDVTQVIQLREWAATAGSTYRYEVENEGHEWTVEILKVKEQYEGPLDYYRCVLELHVLAMTTLYGSPYTGT